MRNKFAFFSLYIRDLEILEEKIADILCDKIYFLITFLKYKLKVLLHE